MTLFTGSILVIVLCQALARQLHFGYSVPLPDLLLAFSLLICAAGILTVWLEARPRRKPVEQQVEPRKNPGGKNPRDTIL